MTDVSKNNPASENFDRENSDSDPSADEQPTKGQLREDWLTVAQAAAHLGVNVRTVRRRCERGKLRARLETTDSGHAWFIDPASLRTPSDISEGVGNTSDHGRSTGSSYVFGYSDMAGHPSDTRIARLEGYAARDLEMIVSHAVEQAVGNAVAPLQQEIAGLRAQIEQLSSREPVSGEGPIEAPVPAIEEALDKSLIPYLKQVQEISAEVDRVTEENERLKAEMEESRRKQVLDAQRPWWKFWKSGAD